MVIDIHIHESKYSLDSAASLTDIVKRAQKIGLDGICITDHESNQIKKEAVELSLREDFLILVGAEILTYQGDILVFGLEELPEEKLSAAELVKLVTEAGGVAISAHPFRDNDRGMREGFTNLEGLTGVESFNGSTVTDNNLRAHYLGKRYNLPCLGSSDAHTLERVGKFATKFTTEVQDLETFIEAIKSNQVYPVERCQHGFRRISTLKEQIE
ncbi:MAG: PHP domain-containing protein [Bacillota bacterium]